MIHEIGNISIQLMGNTQDVRNGYHVHIRCDNCTCNECKINLFWVKLTPKDLLKISRMNEKKILELCVKRANADIPIRSRILRWLFW